MTGPPEPVPDAAEPIPVDPIQNPESYRVTRTLDDGGQVRLRAIRPDDKQALQAGIDRVSSHAVYARFFEPKNEFTDAELAYLTEVDFHEHVGIVATLPQEDALVGVGRYILLDAEEGITPRAEGALIVADCEQSRGIGSLLFEQLSTLARNQGIRGLAGTVLPGNQPMRNLLEAHGTVVDEVWHSDGVRLTVRLAE